MKAKDITLGGILIALGIAILYLTTIIKINTLALLTLCSCLIPIAIIRSNLKTAFFVYISTSIISFFIVPINYAILYTMFFGIYGIIKFFIERTGKLLVEIILKILYFNFILAITLIFIDNLLPSIDINMNIGLLLCISQVVFIAYDYAMTIFLTYFLEKINKKLK